MVENNGGKHALPPSFLPSQSPEERSGSRRRLTPPNTQSEGSAIKWSSSPPQSLLKQANKKYKESTSTLRGREDNCQNLVTTGTPRLFQSGPIRAELTTIIESIPFKQDQSAYISQHPLISRIRSLSPIIDMHKLKRCLHRDKASEYQAHGGRPGARCTHCRFPIMLCLRTAYRKKIDLKYSSKVEALEKDNILYNEQFVILYIVYHGRGNDGGVSQLSGIVLHMMGWQDWEGLRENGPEHIQRWLEEIDKIRGL
ncbi:hypothetical protein DER46DRAFT_624739 [Fusarium sp. MPI-SDFR-AT-0072]|nr:hypothetical protein DER46DRAFT_624739 [Fusarium sp. MPI-SDFR-AT-0072]